MGRVHMHILPSKRQAYPAEGVPTAGHHRLLQRVMAHATHASVQGVLLSTSWRLAGGRSGGNRVLRCGCVGTAR